MILSLFDILQLLAMEAEWSMWPAAEEIPTKNPYSWNYPFLGSNLLVTFPAFLQLLVTFLV